MSKIIDEILYDLRKNQLFVLILIFQLTVSMTISFVTVSLYADTKIQSTQAQKNLSQISYHQIYDNLVGEYEDQFFASENYLSKLKMMYFRLKNQELFEYLEIYRQPVELIDFPVPDSFLYGYSQYADTAPNKRTFPDGSSHTFYFVNTYWISENVPDSFQITCHSGRLFKETDFYLNKTELPIIVGYDYGDFLQPGDKIHGNIILKDNVTLVVIGILEKGSYLYHQNSYQNLDQVLLLPSFQDNSLPSDAKETIAQKILYLMKINGTLKSDAEPELLQNVVEQICVETQVIPSSTISGASNAQNYMLQTSIAEIEIFIRLLCLVLLALSFTSLLLYIILKLRKNRQYYAILQMAGFSLSSIFLVIIGSILAIVIIADLLSIILSAVVSQLLGATPTFTWVFLLWNTTVFATSFTITSYQLKHCELVHFLREEQE